MKIVMRFANKSFITLIVFIVLAGVAISCQSAESQKAKPAEAKKAGTETARTVSAAQLENPDTAGSVSPVKEQKKLLVYYFHTNYRCPSCLTIEALTKEAVEFGFREQIKNGRLEMKVINIEDEGNGHYEDDYKLYTKSVVLSDLTNGKEIRWKNLDQVWTLLRDDNKFIDYIKREVKSYL